MDINEKAFKYAEHKANEGITKMIADAYMEGFKDGYAVCKQENPIEFREKRTEYIDLGLPSGTLWATDYEKQNGEIQYLPYCKARIKNLPTEDQIQELMEKCKWEECCNQHNKITHIFCVGPNGSKLTFNLTGYIKIEKVMESKSIYFWTRDNDLNETKKAMFISTQEDPFNQKEIKSVFSGYHLAIRLVL